MSVSVDTALLDRHGCLSGSDQGQSRSPKQVGVADIREQRLHPGFKPNVESANESLLVAH
jgi:hypothetical protein